MSNMTWYDEKKKKIADNQKCGHLCCPAPYMWEIATETVPFKSMACRFYYNSDSLKAGLELPHSWQHDLAVTLQKKKKPIAQLWIFLQGAVHPSPTVKKASFENIVVMCICMVQIILILTLFYSQGVT